MSDATSEATFEYNGETYSANPDLDTLMEEAGMSKRHINGYQKKLAKRAPVLPRVKNSTLLPTHSLILL